MHKRNSLFARALSKQHSSFDRYAAREGPVMTNYEGLVLEERARITEIQDLLIERFVEHKEAIQEGQEVRAKELEAEIRELQREKENVTRWAAVGSA